MGVGAIQSRLKTKMFTGVFQLIERIVVSDVMRKVMFWNKGV